MDINSALQENDWLEISDKAAKNPAVSAFRNCIASYSAREVRKDTNRTWADLLIRDDPVVWALEFRDGLLIRFAAARTTLEAEAVLGASR